MTTTQANVRHEAIQRLIEAAGLLLQGKASLDLILAASEINAIAIRLMNINLQES